MRTIIQATRDELTKSHPTDDGRPPMPQHFNKPGRRRRHWVFPGALLLAFSLAVVCGLHAQENRGAEQMVLDGGNGGPVPFPHQRHQDVVGDCQVCHKLFPQQAGSIDKLKADGQLARKQVMNKLCIQCHKQRGRSGDVTGPTTCTQCHRK